MLTSTPEFKAVLRMLHDSGREVTPDELLEWLDGKRDICFEFTISGLFDHLVRIIDKRWRDE